MGQGLKNGLGGTHRHSLEKLKEYESHLLMTSAAINNSNHALLSGSGAPVQLSRDAPLLTEQHGLSIKQHGSHHLKTFSHH